MTPISPCMKPFGTVVSPATSGWSSSGSTVKTWNMTEPPSPLGICLGLQVMVIEYARNVCGLDTADSTEFAPDTPHPVISLLEEQVGITDFGGTMRLGRGETKLVPGNVVAEAYGAESIHERHRHRYEVSNQYRGILLDTGLVIAGTTPDGTLVESVTWPSHPWGAGVQFHPEFTSKPLNPHPLFVGFIGAAAERKTSR